MNLPFGIASKGIKQGKSVEGMDTMSAARPDDGAWARLSFFEKLKACRQPMRWYVMIAPLLGLYGCLFYVLVGSTVYYEETDTIRPFLFADQFMLTLLILVSIGVVLSMAACVLLLLFKRSGVMTVYTCFSVYLGANLYWLFSTLIHPPSFFRISRYVGVFPLVFIALMFFWNIRYFKRRMELFI